MDQQSTGTPVVASPKSPAAATPDRRNVWIVTGYAIAFLLLFLVLAYYVCAYLFK